eukprot:gb/GFBE01011934.1/.p1 GENE.gb/GFBE01011934.1/~~gb/GFBE01011934.1/.p1  ORF type:complete len:289 (+),score=65.09 gb/GFBE01011934.1/:1-867(+)
MEEPPPKRMRAKTSPDGEPSGASPNDAACNREDLCAGGDLIVHVDGCSLLVHSLILQLASPVFKAMLSSKMQEGIDKEIFLKGKNKQEFVTFWKMLQPGNFESITSENAHFLLQWADEYQIEGLKCRCEEFLMAKEVPREPLAANASLQEACIYRMTRRREQVLSIIKGDMPRYLGGLDSIAPESAESLREIWPELCDAAGVAVPGKQAGHAEASDAPPTGHISSMWPFIAAAIRTRLPAKRFQDFRRSVMVWPRMLEAHLARYHPAADRPKASREFLGTMLEPFRND